MIQQHNRVMKSHNESASKKQCLIKQPLSLNQKIVKMKNSMVFLLMIFGIASTNAQSDIQLITNTLMDYIEGSTDGQPERLKTAFHSDLNLYSIKKDGSLSVWSGKDYITDTKEGKPTGEGGKIISIDYENDIAVAKVEISHPKSRSTYVDYFMLLKIKDQWTIVHKMYTKRTSNKIYAKE